MTRPVTAAALLTMLFLAACAPEQPRAPSGDPGLDGALWWVGTDLLSGDGGSTAAGDTAPTPVAADAAAPATPDQGEPDQGAPAPPSKVVLNIVWQGQQTGYWCGPGATRIALSAKMSASNLPSQTQLASYMGTTTNGTDHIGLVRDALNHYLKASWYKTHTITDPPTTAQRTQLKKDLLKNIDAGYAMVGNVISGWRPPGYPAGTIYHYIAIVGYDENGDKVKIADPAGAGAAGSKWANVPKTYWISTWNLGTWIGGKGYAG
jgi:hypothetical protein